MTRSQCVLCVFLYLGMPRYNKTCIQIESTEKEYTHQQKKMMTFPNKFELPTVPVDVQSIPVKS